MLPDWDLTLRLLIAAALGSVIGIERERLAWAAGLRTHMLVSVGSCLAMIVSAYGFSGVLGRNVVLDPSRVAAQVISGVGFLGAGSIILRNEVVKGLTTAASLWAVAAVGLRRGRRPLHGQRRRRDGDHPHHPGWHQASLEERFRKTSRQTETGAATSTAPRGAVSIGLIEQALGWRAPQVKRLIIQAGESAELDDVTVTLAKVSPREVPDMIRSLAKLPSVTDVRESGSLRTPSGERCGSSPFPHTPAAIAAAKAGNRANSTTSSPVKHPPHLRHLGVGRNNPGAAPADEGEGRRDREQADDQEGGDLGPEESVVAVVEPALGREHRPAEPHNDDDGRQDLYQRSTPPTRATVQSPRPSRAGPSPARRSSTSEQGEDGQVGDRSPGPDRRHRAPPQALRPRLEALADGPAAMALASAARTRLGVYQAGPAGVRFRARLTAGSGHREADLTVKPHQRPG